MNRRILLGAAWITVVAVSACASTSGASGGTSTAGAVMGASTATPASGYGFVVAPMAVVPPAQHANGFEPTALAADGQASSGSDRFGRVERDRVTAVNGQVLLQLGADGAFEMPWNTASGGPRMRLTAQGLETVNNGTTTLTTVNAQGEYLENGTATGAHVAPYTAANRDTALLLRVLHAISFMHGMATASAGTTAH
jgi:hypothetical protein